MMKVMTDTGTQCTVQEHAHVFLARSDRFLLSTKCGGKPSVELCRPRRTHRLSPCVSLARVCCLPRLRSCVCFLSSVSVRLQHGHKDERPSRRQDSPGTDGRQSPLRAQRHHRPNLARVQHHGVARLCQNEVLLLSVTAAKIVFFVFFIYHTSSPSRVPLLPEQNPVLSQLKNSRCFRFRSGRVFFFFTHIMIICVSFHVDAFGK